MPDIADQGRASDAPDRKAAATGAAQGHAHDSGHQHGPGHEHGHGHSHSASVTQDSERRILWVMLLTLVFMLVEVVGGVISGSLALIADAAHMLTDLFALFLAWIAFRLSRRPADPMRSYGYHRFQVVASYTNGLFLLLITAWIVYEAAQRLLEPEPIQGWWMLGVALAGMLANAGGMLILALGDRRNLNMRAALLHVVSDLLGSLGAVIAAGVIIATGWVPIDPLLSVLFAVLILRSAWIVTRRSVHVLLEGTPDDHTTPEAIAATLRDKVAGVLDVHHIHFWSLTAERPLLTLHVAIAEGAAAAEILANVKAVLRDDLRIDHTTVQIDIGACPDGEFAGAGTGEDR
ncbi:MAG: cation diffusion facilitator family transporter [Sneathiellaceae bacterium]